MCYRNHTLCDLLEFALKVPEVGAVNFNILYVILKTIIEYQGLENVKPDFKLDALVSTNVLSVNEPTEPCLSKEKDDLADAEAVQKTKVASETELLAESVSSVSKSEKSVEAKLENTRVDETIRLDLIAIDEKYNLLREEIEKIYELLSELSEKTTSIEEDKVPVDELVKTKMKTVYDKIDFLKERSKEQEAKIKELKENKANNHEIESIAQKLRKITMDATFLRVQMTALDENQAAVIEETKNIKNEMEPLRKLSKRVKDLEVIVYEIEVDINIDADSDEVTPLFRHAVDADIHIDDSVKKAKPVGIPIIAICKAFVKDKDEVEESEEEFYTLVERKKSFVSDTAVAIFEKLKQNEEPDEEFSDEELYEEEIEKPKNDEDFEEEYVGELPDEIECVPRDRATISSEMLEEHSRQLKGQVIVYVKKQIQSILDDMKQMESELITVKKKTDRFDQCLQDVSEKISFKDHSFTKKADELRALRNMAENHQLSLVHITKQLEQKAEKYIVREKVSKYELSAIEHRMQQLCERTSSKILAMENKFEEFSVKLNTEVDKKLYSDDYDVRLEPFVNKLEKLERKMKEINLKKPEIDLHSARPVRIQQYIFDKNKSRILRGGKRISRTPVVRPDHYSPAIYDDDMSKVPAEAKNQAKNMLEDSSIRNTKRYCSGEYTKTVKK